MVSSSAFKGPSHGEWEANREVITELYKTNTAANVRDIMLKRGFTATLNMYDTRFRKWGLSKYMKASEKTQYLHSIIKAAQGPPNHSQTRQGLPDIGDLELMKLLRHMRRLHHLEARREIRPEDFPGSEGPAVKSEQVETAAGSLVTGIESDRCDENVGNDEAPSTETDIQSWPTNSLSLYSASCNFQTTQGSIDMCRLLNGVRASCSAISPAVNTSSAIANKAFWSNVQQAIHLFRTSCSARAWPALSSAYSMAAEALRSPDILSFVHEALATLSPTNTKESPLIRLQMLRYLATLSGICVGEHHPITIVLRQLCLDDVNKRDVSERSLQYLTEILATEGSEDRRFVALDAQLSLSRLLRKDNDHEAALKVAQAVHAAATETFGPGSLQAVKALRQQVHVFIDARKYIAALEHGLGIITHTGFETQDAIFTMEDIAHIYEHLGNLEARRQWLNRAAVSAQCLWGDTVATAHITDKILGFCADRASSLNRHHRVKFPQT